MKFDQLRKVPVGTKGIFGFSVDVIDNREVQLSDSEGRVIILEKSAKDLAEASRLIGKKKIPLDVRPHITALLANQKSSN